MIHPLLQTLGMFAVTCLVIEVTPGPNMVYLAVVSAVQGRRAGFSATVGIALGLLGVGCAAALGLAAVISSSALAHELLRVSGVVYLLWLAWDSWRAADEAMSGGTETREPDGTHFRRGLVTNLLNPKAAVFYITVLPSFVDPARPTLGQTLLLTVIYVAIASGIHGGIVSLAGAARPFLEDRERSLLARRASALVLAVIAVWFGVSTARLS
jgi:threonine/homoserine/homoserine lactone efflux protein